MRKFLIIVIVSLLALGAKSQVVYPDWIKKEGTHINYTDVGYSIASDDSNYTYVVSVCADSAIIGDSIFNNGGGCYLAKYNPIGGCEWVKRVHPGISYPHVSCGTDNSIYVCGNFGGGAPIPFQFGDTTLTTIGDKDIFLAKYNSSGDFIWVRQVGGLSDDICGCVGVDHSDNAYITGYFQDTVFFNDTTTISNSPNGTDSFVAKYDSSGNELWVKIIESASPTGHGFAFDSDNNVITTGFYYAYVKIENDSIISQGQSDIYLCKLDSNGNKIWLVTAGGTGSDDSRSIVVDANDNIFMCGSFIQSANFGSTVLNSFGSRDGYLAKYNSMGNLIWVNHVGGMSFNDNMFAIATDGYNIYSTGWFGDTALVGGTTLISTGMQDVFVSKYDNQGNSKWSMQGAGLISSYGHDITINSNGEIYLTGYFAGLIDFGGDTMTPNGGINAFGDVFIVKLLEKIPSAIIFQSADTIFINDSIIFSNMSINAINYDWDFGDGFTDTTSNPTHKYLNSGQYTVRLIAHNQFYSDTAYSQVIVLNGVGVKSLDDSAEGFKLYPNPASEIINVTPDGLVYKIEIVDMLGKHYTVQLRNQNRIDVSELPAGNYMLRITMESGLISKGFIKQ
jgi:PKD repeat protein